MMDRPLPRSTRQRTAILQALAEEDGFRSAQDLHDRLRRGGKSVGLTTVYRTLQALALRGEIDVLHNSGGESIYRRCESGDHHHHLVCTGCGRSVEVASEEIETWARKTAADHGFSSVTHTAEVYGLCRTCS
jgi:Fur family ferric uptake transcriptional regulator